MNPVLKIITVAPKRDAVMTRRVLSGKSRNELIEELTVQVLLSLASDWPGVPGCGQENEIARIWSA
ncbi:MAG: hypothetical protein ACI9R3_003942 [Verrucomicrobiales bacterium]|jgi:hypothetical protein